MNKEVLFAQTLEKVKKIAKDQGNCISKQQVQEEFTELDLDNQQLEMVLDYLIKHKIGIDEPVDIDNYLTDEDRDYLQDYLLELEAFEQVTEGEKEAITLSAMAGDSSARNRLTEIYLKDVIEIAKLYAGQGVFLEDLIGEGNVALTIGTGMIGCMGNAKEAQGMLGKMIMDAMEDYIAENISNKKTDQEVVDKINLIMEKAKELAEDLCRKVTPQELADETQMPLHDIMDAVEMSGFQIEYIEVQ